MFLQLPFSLSAHLQQTAFVVNTVILIIALIVVELVYSETPKRQRRHLKYFYPLCVVLVGILAYAAFIQVGKA